MKKIGLLLILWCYSPIAFAGFWDAVGACFTDPCNCGDSNPDKTEFFDGEEIRTIKKNQVCPPWNKNGGRAKNTCLLKSDFPGAWIGYYENLCGEQTPESTYFTPKNKS